MDLDKYYLCGIGGRSGINDFQVGAYNKNNESFSFSNGSYSATVLYKEARGGNETRVISAISLQEIDDANLLYKTV